MLRRVSKKKGVIKIIHYFGEEKGINPVFPYWERANIEILRIIEESYKLNIKHVEYEDFGEIRISFLHISEENISLVPKEYTGLFSMTCEFFNKYLLGIVLNNIDIGKYYSEKADKKSLKLLKYEIEMILKKYKENYFIDFKSILLKLLGCYCSDYKF